MRRVLIALALLFLPLAPAGAGDRAYCHQASGAEAAGNYDLAIDYYTRCLKSVDLSIGNQAIFYNNRGEVYYRKGEYDRAIADYDQALRLDPDFAFAYNGRGSVYIRKGAYDRAIADIDQALRLDPDFALAYNNRGSAYFHKGEYDRAIEYLYDLEEIRKAWPYNGRGSVYYRKGAYDRAIADFDQALRLDPDYALAYNGRGNAYTGKGEHDRAIADFDQALRLDPDYASVYNDRGRTHFYRGRFAHAVPDLRRAVAADPEDAYRVLWLYLAQARAGQGGRAELGDNARRLDLSDWSGSLVRMFLGELNAQAVAGMGEANRTRQDKERRAEAYFYVGQQQLMAGHTDNAAAFFRAVVKTGITNFIEYIDAKAELKRLGQ